MAKLDSGREQSFAADQTKSLQLSLTAVGTAMGTVSYMSPEQARGAPLDTRSDLFSFGVMLYEMITGRLPFAGGTATAILAEILHVNPAPAAQVRPGVPAELSRIIGKALEKDRDLRYQSAAELHADLSRLKRDRESRVSLAPRGRRRGSVLLIGFAAVALVAAFLGWRAHAPRAASLPTAPVHPEVHTRRAVAVLGFQNLTARPDVAWLSTALSEMLSTELAAGGALRVISSENVARMRIDLGLPQADTFGEQTLARIRKQLSTDLVVLGSYTDLGAASGGKIRLDLRLQDTSSGGTVSSVSQTGIESDLFELVSRTGSLLRKELGAGVVSPGEGPSIRASLPADPGLARVYAEGLTQLRLFDAQKARTLLEKVVSGDPAYARGRAALSLAYSALGFDEKAKREAQKALELSNNLPREDRLYVEGRYREASRDWASATRVYQSLFDLFPDNVDYGIRLASAQTSAGQPKDALTTLDSLRHLKTAARDDPRIDLAQGEALGALGEFEQEVQALRSAAAKAEGAGLLLARARSLEGWTLSRLGKPTEALSTLEHARDLFAKAGQYHDTGRALTNMATIAYEQNDFTKARQLLKQALDIFKRIGDRSGTGDALNELGNILYRQGDLEGAKSMYEQSLVVLREIDSKAAMAGSLGNLANVLEGQGDLAAAETMNRQTLAAFREVEDQRGAASTLDNLGEVLLQRGRLTEARQTLEESLAQQRKIGFKNGVGYTAQSFGEVLQALDDLPGARRAFEESIHVRRELGQLTNAAAAGIDLAELSLDEGKPALAEMLARDSIKELVSHQEAESEAAARAVLALALVAEKKLAEAQMSIAQATKILPSNAAYPSRFAVKLTLARTEAAAEKRTAALAAANQVMREARQHGFDGYELEARLALGEFARQSRKTEGVQQLLALEGDAKARSFFLIARKAHIAQTSF